MLIYVIVYLFGVCAAKAFELEDAELQFETFIQRHGKQYADENERQARFEIFKVNLEEVNRLSNRQSDTIFVPTMFMDLTHEEFLQQYTGVGQDMIQYNCSIVSEVEFQHIYVPEEFDWRKYNVVTPIKHQHGCGSCYAFNAIANIESQFARKYGLHLDLSEQQIIDCDRTSNSCNSGYTSNAFLYLIEAGAVSERDHPYRNAPGICQNYQNSPTFRIADCRSYFFTSQESVKQLLVRNGPIAISIQAASLYSYPLYGDIITDEICNDGLVNHGVLLVGYGYKHGVPIWIAKNSWVTLAASKTTPSLSYREEDAEFHFERFIEKHNKQYIDEEQKQFRFKIFVENMLKANEMNEQSDHAVFGITQFSDLTPEEFVYHFTGLAHIDLNFTRSGCKDVYDSQVPDFGAPESFDWRQHNAVTRVKNQGYCGGCYAFSVSGNIEGQYAIKHGNLIELSEQQMVDCDKNSGGCCGGLMTTAFRSIIDQGGIETEDDYPYKAAQRQCQFTPGKAAVRLSECNLYNVKSQEKVKQLLYKFGPLSIGLKAKSFQSYHGGIMSDEKCDKGELNHAVLLVGYGVVTLAASKTAPSFSYREEDAKYHFERFIIEHNKEYIDEEEKQFRFNIFVENLLKANEMNEQSDHAVFGITQFSDLTPEEFVNRFTGLADIDLNFTRSGCKDVYDSQVPDYNAPESFDWRQHNAVTRVKDQEQCGGCYAFSVSGNIEGQYAIKHGNLIELSEQQTVDCDKNSYGCRGGLMTTAFRSIIDQGGIETEADYPYKAAQRQCQFTPGKAAVRLSDCNLYNVKSQEKVKQLLYKFGPLSIGLKAESFQIYHGGIMSDEECDKGQLNHAVLLVGYGVVTLAASKTTPSFSYREEDAKYHFERFIIEHNKEYIDEEEKQFRFNIFVENLLKANEMNEQSITQFSDLTPEEFVNRFTGLADIDSLNFTRSGCKDVYDSQVPDYNAPESFDWCQHNAVTRVKDQEQCGGCYAFSVSGNIEGQYAIKHGNLIELSEQQTVDCDKNSYGCRGGLMTTAFRSIIDQGGIETEADYPYKAAQRQCQFTPGKAAVRLSDCNLYNVKSQEKVKQLLYKFGPLSIGLKAESFQIYHGGIMSDEECDKGQLNHAVLLVGYGVENGKPYWTIKNSWGTTWGEQAYIRIHRGENALSCGMINNGAMSSAVVM
ncbi:hypothetical protein PYW07_001353 [Mythimna separata]|uniref:Cathepsin L n=1 Tax=Mythimna separata TaxID=271217 RepID=A0AAD8DWV6_MYTSE|nr:hypothetical protein PYW07_001353 [Mythimna separata]